MIPNHTVITLRTAKNAFSSLQRQMHWEWPLFHSMVPVLTCTPKCCSFYFVYTMLVLIKYTLQYTKNRCSLYFLIIFEEVCLVVCVFGDMIAGILPSVNPMCSFHCDDKDEEIWKVLQQIAPLKPDFGTFMISLLLLATFLLLLLLLLVKAMLGTCNEILTLC